MFIGREGGRVPPSKMSPILVALASGQQEEAVELIRQTGLTAREGLQLYKDTLKLVRKRRAELRAEREKNRGELPDARTTGSGEDIEAPRINKN